MSRLLWTLGALTLLATYVWGVPGLAWSLVVGPVVWLVTLPLFVEPDPCDVPSALDRMDGRGVVRDCRADRPLTPEQRAEVESMTWGTAIPLARPREGTAAERIGGAA